MPEVVKQRYDEAVPLDLLTEYPGNPRIHDDSVLTESVDVNGFYGSVIAREDGTILAGHGRVDAARAAGLDSVPVIFVDVDDDTARRILLVDNRANDLAGYDDRALAAILEDLRSTDEVSFAATGFDDQYLAGLILSLGDSGPLNAEGAAVGQESEDMVRACPSCGFKFGEDTP